jgi:transposase
MYLRTTSKKHKGQTYRYVHIVESVWENGRSRQKTVLSLGRKDQIDPKRLRQIQLLLGQLAGDDPLERPKGLDVGAIRYFGQVVVLQRIWEELGLGGLLKGYIKERGIRVPVEHLVRVMVFNRLIAPRSKLALSRWIDRLYLPELFGREIPLHYFYRAIDYVNREKERIENALFSRLTNLFSLKLSLVFYDLTSTWFEGDCCPLAEYGYSRDKRFDKKQIVLGLLATAEGLPIAHQIWNGKRVDVTTVQEMTASLKKRFQIGETIFVGDCGMLSAENLEDLTQAGYRYILGLKSRSQEAREVIVPDAAGPVSLNDYEVIEKDKLLAREVKGSGGVRYIICHSFERAQVDRAQRTRQIKTTTAKLETLDADLKSGRVKEGETLQRRLATIFGRKHVKRYFHWSCDTKNGRPTLSWSLNAEAVAYEEHREGKWVIKTDASLTVADTIRQYKNLQCVENAFDDMKHLLVLRPIRHYAPPRVEGHVLICVLAYLVARILELRLAEAGVTWTDQIGQHRKTYPMTAARALDLLNEVKAVEIQLDGQWVDHISRIGPHARSILQALGVMPVQRTIPRDA